MPAEALRSFVIEVELEDGSVQELVLTRPVSWIASRLLIAAEINAELAAEEDAAHRIANPVLAGWRDVEGWTASAPLVVAAAVPVEVSTSVPGRLISRGVNPTGLFGAALSMVGETVTASMLDGVASRSFQSELETAILAGETNGLELYVDLPELEVEAWGVLKRVEPARATLDRADSEAVSPSTHRLLRLTASRQDGSTTRIELVRSVDWIRENLGDDAANWVHENHSYRPTTVGSAPRLQINLPELRLNGYADVTAIEPCPAIRPGPGEVVTATYHTDRAEVIDLRFEGTSEPLGTTSQHPFWSVTRQSFVPAGELLPEETVVGIDGQHYRLTSITPRAGPLPVYNLEVAGQHSYFVTANGLLVHNAVYVAKLFHGTSVDSAVGLLNGRKLLKSKAAAKHLGEGKLGFYLATHIDDAKAFGRRHAAGKFTVLELQFSQKALNELRKAGLVPGPIPGTPNSLRTVGQQLFVGPENFALFNRLLKSGDINIVPFLK